MAQQIERRAVAADPSPADADGTAFLRWAGYCGLLASLAYLTTVVVLNVAGVGGFDGPDQVVGYLRDVSDLAWSSYAYGLAGIAMSVLYVPMAVGVHRLLGRAAGSWFGSAAIVAGLAILFPAYVAGVVLPAALAPAAAELGVAGADVLYVVAVVTETAAGMLFAVGSVLSLGFGPLLWGAEWLRTRRSDRWLGWLGVITGTTGMVWFAWGVASPLQIALVLVNVLASLVLFTGLSMRLVAAGR